MIPRGATIIVAVLVGLSGCRRTETAAVGSAANDATMSAPAITASPGVTTQSATAPAQPPRVADTPQKAAASQANSVASTTASSASDGAVVILRGLCLPRAAHIAFGAPPRTRSDWQLGDLRDSTSALWVSGPRPSGCSPEQGGSGPVAIQGTLATDTVKMLSGPPTLLRFVLLTPRP